MRVDVLNGVNLDLLGRRWALVIYALDLMKGLAPVLVCRLLLGDPAAGGVPVSLLAGIAAFLGHCFPIWHGFRGGKGVATGSGVILGTSPPVFLIAIGLFVLLVLTTRMVSVGSIIASAPSSGVSFTVTRSAPFSRPDIAKILPFGVLNTGVSWPHGKSS